MTLRILLISHKFPPDVGGIERMSELLANGLQRLGHEVVVLTWTEVGAGRDTRDFPYTVVRRPGPIELLRYTFQSDVVFHNNICLQMAWPLLLVRRPWVVAVRTWIRRSNGRIGLRDRVKSCLLRWASVISISHAVANSLSVQSVVIHNSYRDDVFFNRHADRDLKSFLFVGRVVDDKGADLLVRAFARAVKVTGIGDATLHVVGDGHARQDVENVAFRTGVSDVVLFHGELDKEDVAIEMCKHGTLVVPSVWPEPFGIVALEGMASGCAVVASSQGGLGEAVDGAGILFDNGDEDGLTDVLVKLLSDERAVINLAQRCEEHSARFRQSAMVARYAEVIEASAQV